MIYRFRFPAMVVFAVMFVFALSPIAFCDDADDGTANDADKATATVENSEETVQRFQLELPRSLPDGRPILPVGIYQSQMVELIPDHYRPESTQRLVDAINKSAELGDDAQASRLRSGEYWIRLVDDVLVSQRSILDLEADSEAVVRRSLGRVNLSIDAGKNRNSNAVSDMLPRLESGPDGDLIAVFQGGANLRTRIDFGWQLRGYSFGGGQEFALRLPPAPQTRIVLAAPPGIRIESLEGVLRERPGPPADSGDLSTDRESKWYEIDAGGLSTVRIRTSVAESTNAEASLVLRRSLSQYDIDSTGLQWSQRMSVQIPADQSFPPLAVSDAVVTSIKVNATDVDFTRHSIDDTTEQLQIIFPAGTLRPQSTSTTVTVTGQCTWSNWCLLPMARWVGDSVVHASATDEVQLGVAAPLAVVEWELPSKWTQSTSQLVDGVRLWTASGPSPIDSSNQAWSRIRLAQRPLLGSGQTWLRVEVGKSTIAARARLRVAVDRNRLEPIRLRMQNGFNVESLVFVGSQRSIESPNAQNSSGSIWLWPESGDVSSIGPDDFDAATIGDDGSTAADASLGELIIDIQGSRALVASPPVVAVPSIWFARIDGARSDLVAAIIPPPDLNWSGDAALETDRVRLEDLRPSQVAYFDGGDRPALYFAPTTGRTPDVMLETPNVSFDVSTSLQIERDGTDIIERLLVDVESAGRRLSELIVQTGAAGDRPSFHWSLSGERGSPSTSLPPSDIALGFGDDEGTYSIDVSELNLRGRPLIARRRYSIADAIEIQLPSVPGAASQRSEVMLGGGVYVKEMSPSVQRVPSYENDASATTSPGQLTTRQRLRYDAVEQPKIVIAKSTDDGSVTIVWRQSVRVIASSRGTDRIEATYLVSPRAPLVINYPPDMQLTLIERSGESVNLLTVSQRPIELPPSAELETIRVVWNRSLYGSHWARTCRIPRIEVSAVVLKSDYALVAASDTFSPTALFRNPMSLDAGDGIEMVPGENVTLIRRNIALAIGWLFALLTFVVGWTIASRWPLVIAVAVVVLATLTLLWWPWKLAVIGWLLVPIIASAMLATSRAWTDRGSQIESDDTAVVSDNNGSNDEASADLSWASIVRLAWLGWWMSLASIATLSPTQALAQQVATIATDATASKAVTVIVPVDRDGHPTSDVVYLPRSVHESLFKKETPNAVEIPHFQTADYRVTIFSARSNVSSGDDTKPAMGSTIEAEYVVHLVDGRRGSHQVRLPIPFQSVRRVELIEEVDRIVRFVADDAGQVVASLPRGDVFRLRVTMVPTFTVTPPWNRLVLPIPVIASSQLTIESEQSISVLRVGGSKGRLLSETDLRRWVTELGPTDTLGIEYRIGNETASSGAAPLRRRYWVNVGKTKRVIECEVDPPFAVAAGESFSFVIRDSEVPIVTSPNWRLTTTEQYSPTRRLMTVTATQDGAGPIRLLWSRNYPDMIDAASGPGTSDIVSESTAQTDSEVDAGVAALPGPIEQFSIPEVIAAALGANAPAWIAIHCDRSLSLGPMNRESAEPLSVDQFMAAWLGYRGLIDRAFVAVASLPTIQVQSIPQAVATATQRHHLHVMPDRMELRFNATALMGGSAPTSLRLAIPRSMELVQLSVDGRPIEAVRVNNGPNVDYVLGEYLGTEEIQIAATAIRQMPKNKLLTPPRMQLSIPSVDADTYTLSRDESTEIRIIENAPIPTVDGPSTIVAESLAQGWIPVATWSADRKQLAASPDRLGGQFEVKLRKTRFDCRQLITLSRDAGRWKTETQIKFESQRLPDFVDVEVPTRWCEMLEVSPATSWSRQPATDPAQQIIRIRCDAPELKKKTLTLTGQLQNADAGRVGVPSIRVLGFGRRRIHISVPDRLTNESIQWRTSAVEAVSLPPYWQTSPVGTESRSTYLAASPAWSIDLAPLPTIDTDAIGLTQDNQVFVQDDGLMVVSHWDLLPGGLESVVLELPVGAHCVAAWSAGTPMMIEPLEESASLPMIARKSAKVVNPAKVPPTHRVRIALSLSRISQSVEVMIRMTPELAKHGHYVPRLVDIPITQNWLAIYEPDDGVTVKQQATIDKSLVRSEQRRAVYLARSTVEAVEQAVDMIAERPTDEIAAWLRPWAARYRQLAKNAGHSVDFSVAVDASMDDELPGRGTVLDSSNPLVSTEPTNSPAITSLTKTSPSITSQVASIEWVLLDQRMSVYINRYLTPQRPPSKMFDANRYDGFRTRDVLQLTSVNKPPSLQAVSTSDRGLRNLLVNLLTLALITGLLVCLRPLRRFAMPVVVHPAFWLGLMGLFGFAVAPTPVAGALILVAVVMPAFPKSKKVV
ncbi:hypothetical protein Poly51_53470 [Rubripirellula tenax]|uniref:Uncharacterized protein n=1 Tax=Rubripirellula tenax TaxID=2528015 RepID=A0A5C6EHM2_9BACT|nr:hypothetical protein [Rubripirellula tenax]TWU47547.1 hypothetical protein Poly51_53470 [Rubripirellula tenax]